MTIRLNFKEGKIRSIEVDNAKDLVEVTKVVKNQTIIFNEIDHDLDCLIRDVERHWGKVLNPKGNILFALKELKKKYKTKWQ